MWLCFAQYAAAQPCVGDCNSDGSVTVDELQTGINIALGDDVIGSCMNFDRDGDTDVTVDEIVAATDRALVGCAATPTVTPTIPEPLRLRVNGTCLRPGATGIIGCAVGASIRGYRCEDRATCASSAIGRRLLGVTTVSSPGSFVMIVNALEAAGALMLFEADVDAAQVYRTFDVGPAAGFALTGSAAGDGPVLEIVLGPDTEAAVRLLDMRGVHLFTNQHILDVMRAVRIANIGTSFAALTPAQAAQRAFDVASADPNVQEALEETTQDTPTPTPTFTPTVTPTRTATLTPTVTSTPISPTPTFTQNPAAIDFGPAGGIPGVTTVLPLQLQSSLAVQRMDLEVQFVADNFAFQSCSGDGVVVNVEVSPGRLQLEILAQPPREFEAGTFAECLFTVTGGPGSFPVSLTGTIVKTDGGQLPVIADGTFEIDAECMNDEDCIVGQEECDGGVCVPLPAALGAHVTYLGLLTASNRVIEPQGTLADGTPIFRPATGLGFGFFIVIEASQGVDGAFPGFAVFPPTGRPDMQLQSDRNLGNGSLQVCDPNGIPGISPPSFDPSSSMITNALRDFGCRFELKTVFQPCQADPPGGFIDADSDAQVCTRGTVTIDSVFPAGDTRLTARWEDENNNLGPPASIIVRVGQGPE